MKSFSRINSLVTTGVEWSYRLRRSLVPADYDMFAEEYQRLLTDYSFPVERGKVAVNISVNFGLIFTILTGIHYFLQITTVRLNILKGQPTGLEQFIQSNPISASAAVNMLGWTIFLGLSSFFIVPVFKDSRNAFIPFFLHVYLQMYNILSFSLLFLNV